MNNKSLRIALQKEGRLADESLEFLRKAGFVFSLGKRNLIAKCYNFPLELLFLRAKDIPEMVCDQTADIGICGQDQVMENAICPLQQLQTLGFGKCRLSLAAPKKINFQKKRIATSYPNLLRSFLERKNIQAEIIQLSGSVEIAPRLGTAEAICDLVSSGSTLRTNGLQELEILMESEAVLIAREKFPLEKKPLLEKFLLRIRAVISARQYKYILMNVPESSVERIRQTIPGLRSPTVCPLIKSGWVSLASVVEEDIFWETIEALKSRGAEGVLVLPIEKMIL